MIMLNHRQGIPHRVLETNSGEQDGSQKEGLGSGRWSTEVPQKHLNVAAIGCFSVIRASAFPKPFRAAQPFWLRHQSGI